MNTSHEGMMLGSGLALFVLCPMLVLHSLGPEVIAIISRFFKDLWIMMVWQISAGLDSPASFLEVVLLVVGLTCGKTIVIRNVNYQFDKI